MQNILTNIERQPDLKKMHERLRRAYRLMLTSRFLDEKQLRLLKQGKSFFQIGGSGHEAAQVAAALALRPGCDWAFPYYRDQSFVLAYGITIRELLFTVPAIQRQDRGKCPAIGETNLQES
jgi:TPP-dependent pyruvate/acetoin dehydrogenase alpha subunit